MLPQISWLLTAAVLAACSPGLGDFCTSDQDCEPGLRCSAASGERGVCTYPTPAIDAGPPDAEPSDRGPFDTTMEKKPEAGPDADTGPVDLQTPDTWPDSMPDQQLPDQTLDTLPDKTVDGPVDLATSQDQSGATG